MDKEIWKDIKDYEGLYQVSNYGNVRSLTRNRLQYNHTGIAKRTYYGKFLKKQLIKTTGYYYVTLYDSRKKLKINSSSISAVCKEKRKTAGGYIWKYERR